MHVCIIYNRKLNEYVVPCPEGNYNANYHTTDREDAFNTAKKMWAASNNDVFFRVRQISTDEGD